jgi:NCAIR mutase (PurE)-related protein
MNAEQLKKLLEDVKAGQVGINDAVDALRHMPFEDLGFAHVDHHRHIRCGAPEVIYCPGKETAHIIEIFEKLAARKHNVLATRASQAVYDALMASGKAPAAKYDPLAKAIILEQEPCKKPEGFIAVVTAGTADVPVAAEAKVTAEIMGNEVRMICDVGVAGIHRLLHHTKSLQQANVIVVVAGMEGALASVVGGLVDCPVIAVPTSIGYGASFGGVAALLTMLNSCASGVSVVNIDNGFAAGYIASLINHKRSS